MFNSLISKVSCWSGVAINLKAPFEQLKLLKCMYLVPKSLSTKIKDPRQQLLFWQYEVSCSHKQPKTASYISTLT